MFRFLELILIFQVTLEHEGQSRVSPLKLAYSENRLGGFVLSDDCLTEGVPRRRRMLKFGVFGFKRL